jgi:hypothetical protein
MTNPVDHLVSRRRWSEQLSLPVAATVGASAGRSPHGGGGSDWPRVRAGGERCAVYDVRNFDAKGDGLDTGHGGSVTN